MGRPSQLRRIVALLRTQRPDAEYRHLLRLAALIIEAHRQPEIVDFEPPPFRPSYHSLALDRAFGDGGWRVLDFERRQGMSFSDDVADDHYRVRGRLWQLMRLS